MKLDFCPSAAAFVARCQSTAWCFTLVGLLVACTASDEDLADPLEAKAPLEASNGAEADGMLLVFVREFSFDPGVGDISEEGPFVACVREAVLETRPAQSVVSFDDFHQAVFPHLNRRSVPRDPEYISTLHHSPEFRRGMTSLGVRYIVFVGGVVEVEASGGGGCFGGGYGAACFGYWEWDKASHVGASVLDLTRVRATDSIETTATGTAWFAMVGVIPLGLPSKPSAVACRLLGRDIARHLARAEEDL